MVYILIQQYYNGVDAWEEIFENVYFEDRVDAEIKATMLNEKKTDPEHFLFYYVVGLKRITNAS